MSRSWCDRLTIGTWKVIGTKIRSLIWSPTFNIANAGCERCGLKGFRVNESSSWAVSQKHGLVATESTVTLGCINKGIMSRMKGVIILYYSALVRPRLRTSLFSAGITLQGRCQWKYMQRKSGENSEGTGKSREMCPLSANHDWAHGEEEAADVFCVWLQGLWDLMGESERKADLGST